MQICKRSWIRVHSLDLSGNRRLNRLSSPINRRSLPLIAALSLLIADASPFDADQIVSWQANPCSLCPVFALIA